MAATFCYLDQHLPYGCYSHKQKALLYCIPISADAHFIYVVWWRFCPFAPPLPPSPYGRKTLLIGKAPTLSSFGFRGSPNWQLVEIVHPVNMTLWYGVISESSQTVSVLKCTCICSWLFLSLE